MRTRRISRRWAAIAAALAVFAAVPVASAADFAVDAVAVDTAVDALAADAALSVTTTADAVANADAAPPVDPAPPVVEVPPVDPAPPVVEVPPVDPAPPVVEVPPVDPTTAPAPVVEPVPAAVTPVPEIEQPISSHPGTAISTEPTNSSTATISEIASPAPVTPLPKSLFINGTPSQAPIVPWLVPLSIESPAFAIPRELSRRVSEQAPGGLYRSAAAQSAPTGLLLNGFLADGPLGTSRMAGLLAFVIGLLPFAPADGKSGMSPPPQLAVLILAATLAAFAALTLPLRDGRRRGPRGYATLALRPG